MPLRRLCKSAFASASTRANNLRVGAGKQPSKQASEPFHFHSVRTPRTRGTRSHTRAYTHTIDISRVWCTMSSEASRPIPLPPLPPPFLSPFCLLLALSLTSFSLTFSPCFFNVVSLPRVRARLVMPELRCVYTHRGAD